MENIITASNLPGKIMVVVPCVLTAAGVVHRLKSMPKINKLVSNIKMIDEAYGEVLKVPGSFVILNISESSTLLAEEIKFINWCLMVQPGTTIVAYTRNHKLSVLNYISALGVRAIISQYEPSETFTDLVIKSFSTKSMLSSPMIKNILDARISCELTVCEAQVIGELFQGYNVSQVAQKLGRNIRTVSAHKRHAMEKLGLQCEKDLHVLGCTLLGK
ncbi:LuxR C-terminal-related transcriptional regulator [Buttiauxella selenatireducens]|uniref:LuxR C-terminal-related transcriptional regulator n=1 Tax=Buttiauxella selenatireducens TaxID=3073902 RepID=A0ABY9SDI4_9ENTR|nr:LuxR C-terminal-related transcriptional regulator [Buttiauxella sp. R73]WMY74955.1 LuxR C-terminal-related transcriptional regulator [Buttiauxella sp. R73]